MAIPHGGAVFIGSEIYRGSTYGSKHPLAIPRVSTVMDLCRALEWLPAGQYRTSPRAKPEALTRFHTEEYIAALRKAERTQSVTDAERQRHGLGTLSNPVFPEMFSRPATAAGGSMLGAELVASGGVVYNPGGGTHHGMADRANGFCFLNDPVLAIRNLQRLGQDRVAYVDIDAHHCDGVEAALTGEPGICLISIHEGRRWPFTGALSEDARGIAWNLPVGRGLNDTEFALILDDLILPVLSSFKPDAIILQCGADALFDDPLSRMELSNNALWSAVASIRRLTQKLLVLGGGGYNPWSVARAWTGVWANLSGQTVPDHLPSAARTVLDRLSWSRRAGRTPPEHWVNTLRDPVRHGRIRDEIKADIATLKRRLTG